MKIILCVSKIIRDLVVFVVAGVILTHCYQIKSSEREEAQKIMNATSISIMKRMYQLERVNFALKSDQLNNAKKLFRKYEDDAIPEWNINFLIYYQEIKRYFDQRLADKLTRIHEKPPSDTLFNYFRKAHDSTQAWMVCMEKTMIEKQISHSDVYSCELEKKNAENSMNKDDGLLKFGTEYIEELNDTYQRKYQSWRSFL